MDQEKLATALHLLAEAMGITECTVTAMGIQVPEGIAVQVLIEPTDDPAEAEMRKLVDEVFGS